MNKLKSDYNFAFVQQYLSQLQYIYAKQNVTP